MEGFSSSRPTGSWALAQVPSPALQSFIPGCRQHLASKAKPLPAHEGWDDHQASSSHKSYMWPGQRPPWFHTPPPRAAGDRHARGGGVLGVNGEDWSMLSQLQKRTMLQFFFKAGICQLLLYIRVLQCYPITGSAILSLLTFNWFRILSNAVTMFWPALTLLLEGPLRPPHQVFFCVTLPNGWRYRAGTFWLFMDILWNFWPKVRSADPPS